ncbi:cbb3-type cytochrome c oxidase N-terminal domain-containing protein [Pedobacter nyackensis]|uniref:Cytochrome c oxidase cbb3-type subunit 3 n=1 Tax=Pedobacter nyackensis TaxID=475255 RepID=A0A1W2ES65_9SPHI|nr:cbb3-type cytochrome c oxidase N-terminal domain-containing protein [Pedobacter nyackensis]SMD12544.1 cytochrome c oxidase cbb3-type subunit 3 [Pedobacter nyackensis]
MNDILIWALLFIAVSILIAAVLVLRVIKIYVQQSLSPTYFASAEEREQHRLALEKLEAEKPEKKSIWTWMLGLKPLSEEKDLIMEHEFDGIAELDNPTPAWFMILFYGTIIFAIGYMVNYHVIGWGQSQEQEYVAELQQAEDNRIALLQKPGGGGANKINESNVEASKDEAVLQAGAALFKNVCTPCHGEHAEGTVGPNLTDDHWLHGGTVKNIFKTIKYGVPDKGMIAWEKSMNAKQISDITSYIMSLKGSNPAGAKAPQGEKE